MPERSGILFTAFEPSGDDHASAVIAELRRRHPDLPMFCWGGPKMAAAGAQLVERTGQSAVIGLPGVRKILEHVKLTRRIKKWIAEHRPALHIPVDSPAANFPICKLARWQGSKVVHLVAPQVWAWASWRVRKLRKRSDLVLCLLPFEEEWLLARGVPAKFVGHPLFDHPLDLSALDRRIAELAPQIPPPQTTPATGGTAPKLALMPGSRPSEMTRCFPILLDAFNRLRRDFPLTTGVVAATTQDAAKSLKQLAAVHGGWPEGLGLVHGETDAVVRWCDFALVVSGTVTLQIARQRKAMVAVYSPSWLTYQLLARWLVSTELFTLPNLIAGRRVIPELIPHFGDGEALAIEVIKLLRRPGYADDQRQSLDAVCNRFKGRNAAIASADEIERVLDLVPVGGAPRPPSQRTA